MDCTYIVLFYTTVQSIQSTLHFGLTFTHSLIHTQWVTAAMQGAAKSLEAPSALSVLPKDTDSNGMTRSTNWATATLKSRQHKTY